MAPPPPRAPPRQAARGAADIIDGLENAPAAFIGLLKGENLGKRPVRVSP
jgi:NADPH-dependent curcumin reductase CurA